MESSDLLAVAFTRLSTSDSRRAALEALIKELTPYEWRFLNSLTNARTFQFDIVGRLPVELISQIFSYLDTSTPWRLQSVSRLWSEKLQSLTVIKSSLSSWYAGTADLQNASLDFCRRKAQSVNAFRNTSWSAPPDSSFRIQTPYGPTQLLVGDNLIWLDNNHQLVRVLNMRSWTSRVLVGTARERIRDVAASEEIVAFTTHSTAYIAGLNIQGPLKKFRVVHTKILSAITCRRRTVACAGYLQDGLLVYIWHFDTQQGRSFTVSYSNPFFSSHQLDFSQVQPEVALLLQPDTETVVICTFENHQSKYAALIQPKRTNILYGRFTYSGETLHSAEQMLDAHNACLLDHYSGSGMCFVPVSHNGLFALYSNGWKVAHLTKFVSPLQFDEQLNAFISPDYPVLITYMFDQSNSIPWENNTRVAWWNDTFIEAIINNADDVAVHKGTSSNPRQNILLEAADFRRAGAGLFPLVNDKYIVRLYHEEFHVCCFDHTVQLPEQEGRLDDWGMWDRVETRLVDEFE